MPPPLLAVRSRTVLGLSLSVVFFLFFSLPWPPGGEPGNAPREAGAPWRSRVSPPYVTGVIGSDILVRALPGDAVCACPPPPPVNVAPQGSPQVAPRATLQHPRVERKEESHGGLNAESRNLTLLAEMNCAIGAGAEMTSHPIPCKVTPTPYFPSFPSQLPALGLLSVPLKLLPWVCAELSPSPKNAPKRTQTPSPRPNGATRDPEKHTRTTQNSPSSHPCGIHLGVSLLDIAAPMTYASGAGPQGLGPPPSPKLPQ